MPDALLLVSSFIHPALAGAGLALGLIPILIHLINRRRYVRMPWAAMAFLIAARRRSVRRIRLEQLLLLAARVGIVVLFGLALARPYYSGSSIVPLTSTRVHRVILIDDSLSMAARSQDGESRFERAKRCAMKLVEAFPTTDPVSVVTCSAPAEAVIGEPAFDHRMVREQLAGIRQTQRGTDIVTALSIARRILDDSEAPPANRAVYLLSDFPRHVWQNEMADDSTAAGGALGRLAGALADSADGVTLIPVAEAEGENVAVTGMDVARSLVAVNRPVRIRVEVTNYGATSKRDLTLQVLRDGEVIRREPLPALTPGESTVATIATVFGAPGTHLVEASITGSEPDALPDDDARYLSIEVVDGIPVLLVDGRPGLTRLTGQAGYLTTALAPSFQDGDATVIVPQIVTEPELAAENLGSYDVVALCNVPRLPGDGWNRLAEFVRAGGGLLLFMGDLVDVDDYNRSGHAGGTGLIPGRLSRAVVVDGADDSALGFAYADLTHSCVREFADHAESGLFSARVRGYLPIELDEGRADVVLRFTNGEPAIIASRFGEGRVMLVTTTANMDWTNLPAKGDYVSLMSNVLAHLVPPRGASRNIMVGQVVHERLTAVESSMVLSVSAPTGAANEGDAGAPSTTGRAIDRTGGLESTTPALVPDGDALALVHGPVQRAGPITVSIGLDRRVFAANVDPAESDLAAVGAEELERQMGSLVRVVSASESLADSRRIMSAGSAEIAPTLLCLVVALLLVEMWMAMHFGSHRVHADPPGERGKGEA